MSTDELEKDDLIGDPEDVVNDEVTTQSAYLSSGPLEWNGIKLEGWSGRRRAASIELGFEGTGSVLDPVRVIYSCCAKPEEIRRVFFNKDIAMDRFLVWAEKHNLLNAESKEWDEAFEIAKRAVEEVLKSEFESGEKALPGRDQMGNQTGRQS